MLRLESVSKSYMQRGLVLDGLNMAAKDGDSISIIGPSGSGKTTLMNIIGLLDRPDSGDIFFNGDSLLGFDPDKSASYRNKNIGFVFQDHLLLPHLTVKENILLPLMASRLSTNEYEEYKTHGFLLMDKVGIAELKDRYPFRISGGEAQRVTLVRALINKPCILLADEPTGSLDTKNAKMLGNLLLEMNREFGITLILATHSAELAGKMNIRLELADGKLS